MQSRKAPRAVRKLLAAGSAPPYNGTVWIRQRVDAESGGATVSNGINETQTSVSSRPSRLRAMVVLAASILTLTILGLALRANLYTAEGISKSPLLTQLVWPALSLAVMLTTVLLAARAGVAGDLDMVWWQHRRSEAKWTCILIVTVLAAAGTTNWLMKQIGTPVPLRFWADGLPLAFFATFCVIAVLHAPIIEELFWRGYVQRTIERVTGGFAACVIQAFVFAALHFRPLSGFAPVFALGLVNGLWRWRRRTLIPVILAHMCLNSIYCAVRWPDWLDCTRVKVTTDYVAQMAELARPHGYNPAHDARYEYEKAMRLAVEMPPGLGNARKRYPTEWSDETREDIREWVTANKKALEHLTSGTKKPYYCLLYQGTDTANEAIPELDGVRTLAFALDARLKLHVLEGDLAQVLSDIEAMCRFARHFEQRKSLVHQLVGLSIRSLAIDVTRGMLIHQSLSPEVLRRLQRQFEEHVGDDDCGMDFALERLVWLDFIQRMFTDEGDGEGHIPKLLVQRWDWLADPSRSVPGSSDKEKEAFRKLSRRETTRCVEAFLEHIQNAAGKTPWEFQNEPNGVRLILANLMQENAFVDFLGRPCIRAMELPWRAKADTEALVATLATQRYAREHGEYPESLDALVEAGYLAQVPGDPYSDSSLLYRRTNGDFLLYSLGADFDDDGGTPSKWGRGEEGGDQVFWPVQETP